MKLIENNSLADICHLINIGMITEPVENLEIVSDKYPEFIVKIIDVNLTQYMFDLLKESNLKDKVDQTETSFYDFIVLTIVKDEETQKRTLLVNPLLELITTQNQITTEDEGGEDEEIENIWSADEKIWNLVTLGQKTNSDEPDTE